MRAANGRWHRVGGVWAAVLAVMALMQIDGVALAASGNDGVLSSIEATLEDSPDYEGKVVYVDFWASWCAPCKKSFPWMQTMYEEYADQGLVIVAVNLDEDRHKADKFLARSDPGFHIRYDPAARLAKQFELQAVPTSLLFDRNGRLVSRHEGFENGGRAALRAEIEGLLRASRAPNLGK